MNASAKKHVDKLLTTLRESPADTTAASDDVLKDVYQYLMAVPPNKAGELHWFCIEAEETTVQAATFLIRLMAYNSSQVENWKQKLQGCLRFCGACVYGQERAKLLSKETYVLSVVKESRVNVKT